MTTPLTQIDERLCRIALGKIADCCPSSLSAYLIIAEGVEPDGQAVFSRSDITDKMCLSWTRFKNSVRDLAKHGIVAFSLREDYLVAEMMDAYLDGGL